MEALSTVKTAWEITKTAGEISKRLFELGKRIKDREINQQLNEILDSVRELKQSASELEDENRALREKLRFKSDDYEFRTPFYFAKAHPDRPLCPKCFDRGKAAPMGEPGQDCSPEYRRCLACGNTIQVRQQREVYGPSYERDQGPWG